MVKNLPESNMMIKKNPHVFPVGQCFFSGFLIINPSQWHNPNLLPSLGKRYFFFFFFYHVVIVLIDPGFPTCIDPYSFATTLGTIVISYEATALVPWAKIIPNHVYLTFPI